MNETLHNHQYSGTYFGTVVSEYPQEFKKIVRELENLTKKVINAQYAVLFNETCIVNNLLPRYTIGCGKSIDTLKAMQRGNMHFFWLTHIVFLFVPSLAVEYTQKNVFHACRQTSRMYQPLNENVSK